MKRIISYLILTGTLYTGVSQQTLEEVKVKYIKKISKTMKKSDVIGTSILITSSDSILWSYQFGYADKANEIEVSDKTLFGLGSVTKTFTGAAVMQLNESNQIDIDRSFQAYLPQLKIKGNNVDQVTSRNILTHHSGLPSDVMKGMFTRNPEHYTEVVNYLNEEYMVGKPNEIRAYSNPGYSLLGHMIQEVTGSSYEEYVEEHILNPLAMNNSGYNLIDQASKTYDKSGEEKEDVSLRDTPAGGLFSSTSEIAHYIQSFLKKEGILSQETYDQLFTQQHLDAELDMDNQYALGWSMAEKPYTGNIYSHTGTTLYYNAALSIAPEVDLGIIILTNSERGGRVYRNANLILNDFAKALGKEDKTKEDVDLGNKKRIKADSNNFTELTGKYVVPGAYFEVYQKGKKLFLKIQGIKVELIPVGENVYLPKPILLGVIPIRLNSNRMYFEEINGKFLMTQRDGNSGKELLAMRYESDPIPDAWKDKLGRYSIINPLEGEINFFQNFELKTKDDLLVMAFEQASNGQKIEMIMGIQNDQRATIEGLGRYAGQSLLVTRPDELKFFGLELKKNGNE